MKILMTIGLFLIAGFAHAEVKPLNTFVPSLCSNTNGSGSSNQSVMDVCVGKLAGTDQQAIEVQLMDGSVRTYWTGLAVKPLRTGINKFPFSGGVLVIRMRDEISGVMTISSGITVSQKISLETSVSGLKFQGSLVGVSVTQ